MAILSWSTNSFQWCLALDITANCICEIHCLALDGFDLHTVHKLSSKEKKILPVPGLLGGKQETFLFARQSPGQPIRMSFLQIYFFSVTYIVADLLSGAFPPIVLITRIRVQLEAKSLRDFKLCFQIYVRLLIFSDPSDAHLIWGNLKLSSLLKMCYV